MTWRTCRVSVLMGAALSFVLSHSPLIAWEADVHYVLTFWLATQAGFDRRDADVIALSDQSMDNSPHHAAIPNMVWILWWGDLGAARDLQIKHFPSDAPVGSPPMRRLVTANGPTARRRVELLIQDQTSNATALVELGEALHPFQDSWSHQGVPDVPFRPLPQLRPELSCAHPEKRGGWASHNADVTHLHVTDLLETAEETYKLMVRYLAVNKRQSTGPAADWTNLVPSVGEFARAATRKEKNSWAEKYISPAQPALARFSARLTLPGASPGVVPRMRALQPPRLGTPTGEAPAALVQRMRLFVVEWLVRQDMKSASTFVDLDGLRDQFVGGPTPFVESQEARLRWCRKLMTMYLIADHSAANGAGHGDPSHSGYNDLPESVQQQGVFTTYVAVEPDSPTPLDFIQVELNGGPAFLIGIQFSTQPYDAIAVVWQQRNGLWSIIRFYIVVS